MCTFYGTVCADVMVGRTDEGLDDEDEFVYTEECWKKITSSSLSASSRRRRNTGA